MVLNVSQFQEKLKGGVRANLFTVELNIPGPIGAGPSAPSAGGDSLNTLSNFMVKSAELPGSTISPIIVPFRGRQLKISGDRTFDPWTVTVINDPAFTIRKALEVWMSTMNNHEDNQGLNDGYFAPLFVTSIGRNEESLRKYKFVNAWPSDLGPISVSFDNENTLQEYQVTFQYQYWLTDPMDLKES